MKLKIKHLILFLTVSILVSCVELKKTIPSPPKIKVDIECDKMNEKAIRDFNNGILEYNYLGYVVVDTFEVFYWKYMKRKYNIIIKASCEADYLEDCYSETMNTEIEKKYGSNFIEKTKRKAKKKFKKTKRIKN